VAIKTILQDRLGSPKDAARHRERLLREARTAGGLAHPNIVTVFDAGEEAGVTYIVMELIRGSTLDDMLPATGTPLPTERALEILAEAAGALDFAHSHDVVHRDVKPSNIMIQADGKVKLADFGIARLVTATTVTMPGSLAGSPYFMSPEQLRSQEATPRSDQYSLAVVAWILLTGSKPFDDDQFTLLVSKIRGQEPPRSSYLNVGADGVLRRALSKKPEARFESCSSFVGALRDACIQTPRANPESGRMKRRRILVAGAAAACLLAAAGVAWRLRPPGPQPDRHEQKASTISPDPIAPPPPVDTRPKPSPPERQASAASGEKSTSDVRSTSGEKSTEKVPPAGNRPVAGVVRTNVIDGLPYVWIPDGSLEMGCSTGDRECYNEEKPLHHVAIGRGFWMGQTEVTVRAYQRFAGAAGRSMPPEPMFRGRSLNRGWADERQPVVMITWDEAHAFCEWTGLRLPTEAEWEYAARGGDPRPRYGPSEEVAWFADNSGREHLGSEALWASDQTLYLQTLRDNENGPHPVGEKSANAFGMRDMLGNVWEWVGDWLEKDYYSHSPGTDPPGPAAGTERVQRGGSWYNGPRFVSPSRRHSNPPATRNDYSGFRCAGQFASDPH